MKTLKFVCRSIILAVLLSSCTELEEVVYSEITETSFIYTEEDTYMALGSAYTPLRLIGNHTNYGATQEVTTDAIVMPYNPAGGWNDGGLYRTMHLHSWTTEQNYIYNMWDMLYTGVLNCNRLISQLEAEKLPIPAGTTKDALLAEMMATRSFYYWLLIDNFGDIPVIEPGELTLPAKTDRADVYEMIVEDLIQSIPKLNEANNSLMYGRFNKWAAKTLLANIYLNSEVYTGVPKWAECLQQCNEVIASGFYSLESNYKDIFKINNENSPEIIFSVPYDNINATGWNLHRAALHSSMKAKYLMEAPPFGTGSIRPIPQFVNTYDPEDKRLEDTYIMGPQYAYDGVTPLLGFMDQKNIQLNFINSLPNGIQVGESEGYRIGKYEIEIGTKAFLSNDFPFFRYAQVLMMKAECLLRTNKANEAATIVTEIRERAFSNNPDKAIVTGEDLTDDTKYNYGYVENYVIVDPGDTDPVEFGGFLDELGYEFAFEFHRRRDIIRFGVFTTKSWLSHKPNGLHRTVFPIPKRAIDTNVNLEQNPNYL
jgi:starch-binding outer membrane protein, SusD/RagB family